MPLIGVLLFFAFLVLAVAGWLWGPPLLAAQRRLRVRRQPFPRAWREILRRRMPLFRRLPADLQLQLKKHIQVLLAEKPFIGCQGLVPTDEMRVLVAAQAGLLLLNRRAGYFPKLRQILLYPGLFVVDRPQFDAAGMTRDGRRVLAGESWQQGQVLLAWDAVVEGAADPGDGQNVVIHEFAHQLDQESGSANGAPWLGRRDRYARWSVVLGAAFQRLQARVAGAAAGPTPWYGAGTGDGGPGSADPDLPEPGPLDPYGASDPAEFFAVASEAFFERPAALAAAETELYAELARFYRVDPLNW